MTRPTMRFGPIKSVAHQDRQALHRGRERLIKARTALLNERRGRRHAYGLIVPPGASTFRKHVREQLATEAAKLTPQSLGLFQQLLEELGALEARVAT